MKKLLTTIGIVLSILCIIVFILCGKNLSISLMLEDDYEKTHYVNDLYDSKELNYRLALSKDEQKIYDEIIEHIINFDGTFIINLTGFRSDEIYASFNKISDVFQAIGMDHPELIQYGTSSYQKRKKSQEVTITINYTMSKEEYDKRILEIKQIINEVKQEAKDFNDYEKVKYIYDYLGNKNTYGDIHDIMGQSAYSAFSNELSPVCAGYAKASQILFRNIGINSLLIFGEAKYNLFIGDAHAWNNVEIDGFYYIYDVTYSSNGKGISKEAFYNGFLKNDTSNYEPWNKKSSAFINGLKYKGKYD